MSNTGVPPSDEDFVAVREYTGIAPADARTLLKKWPKWTDAVQHYFEDPIGSLKEDVVNNREWEPQDNIPYSFDTSEIVGMSRPPSRNEDSKRMIDLSEEHAQATVRSQYEIEQDNDFKRAVAESMKSMPSQESGVTGTGQTFGPANRSHYDPSQWALAPLSSSRELLEHPLPAQRSRIQDQPAFLYGSTDTGYMGSLLTIYHSIPLAREALLFPSFRAFSYGHDPLWWSGSTNENNKAISFEQTETNNRIGRNLLCEIQCLMAFLDGTNRAYGSVDALAHLHLFQNIQAESPFTKLLHAWNFAATAETPDDPLNQVFTSTAMKSSECVNSEPNKKDLYCLEPPIPPGEDHETLGQLLDDVVWNDLDPPLDDVWIDHAAEIFTMRIHASEANPTCLGLTVPETWFADRYLYEFRDISMEMRKRKMSLMFRSRTLGTIQKRMAELSLPDGTRRGSRQVLDAGIKLAPVAADDSITKDLEISDAGSNIEISVMQQQLTGLLQAVEAKLKELDDTKAALAKQMKQIMLEVTAVSDESSHQLRNKYFLQGVSTKPNITYVRRRNHDLLGLHQEEHTESIDEWQWWRIAWNGNRTNINPSFGPHVPMQPQAQAGNDITAGSATQPMDQDMNHQELYSIRKVEPDDVINAARTEHNSVVLVYAKETAINFQVTPVSAALKHFVERDNRAFAEELDLNNSGARRKWSNDTNTTIMDCDSTNGSNLLHSDSQETMSMNVSDGSRDEDGQPSPKRPRSSEGAWSLHEFRDEPPPYEASFDGHEMQEKPGNKIGFLANQLMERYGDEASTISSSQGGKDSAIHIEHPNTPLR